MSVRKTLASAFALSVVSSAASAAPIYFDGITFPEGEVSFADSVVDFSAGTTTSTSGIKHPDATEALGTPDYTKGEGYVSLGFGGSLTLAFTDNAFTGSGSSAADLFIIEIGTLTEGVAVEISKDGSNFSNVGSISAGPNGERNYGIDLDAYGFGTSDIFTFVRLTDDKIGGSGGIYAGADIDAVGAVTSVAYPQPLQATAALTPVPLPAAGWLMVAAFGGLAAMKRRKS